MEILDTISAISTPLGEGGIGIIRMSGPKASKIALRIFTDSKGRNRSVIRPFKVNKGYILNPENLKRVDEVILLFMPSPQSYTCEDLVEIQCHGGIFIVNKILDITLKSGARLAEPGEFTKRAFLNGRLDLTQAEAVIDLVKGDSESGVGCALNTLRGSLGDEIKEINGAIIDVAAIVEAAIDFPEEDIELASSDILKKKILSIILNINALLNTFYKGRIFRNGIDMVIAGRPNVGKSSLLNTILMENRAIVSRQAGTTRDIIEESITIQGIKFRLKDTAGLRLTDQEIEGEGINRAIEAAEKADIVLFVLDASEELLTEDINSFKRIKNKNIFVLLNKTDLPEKIDYEKLKEVFSIDEFYKISASKNIGIDQLKDALKEKIITQKGLIQKERSVITRKRHKHLLEKMKKSLENAVFSVEKKLSEEFIAVDINQAREYIEEITGKKVTEDILDKIFSEFCIGK